MNTLQSCFLTKGEVIFCVAFDSRAVFGLHVEGELKEERSIACSTQPSAEPLRAAFVPCEETPVSVCAVTGTGEQGHQISSHALVPAPGWG